MIRPLLHAFTAAPAPVATMGPLPPGMFMPRQTMTQSQPSPSPYRRSAVDLLAIDLDGTLLRQDKRLSKRNVKAVKQAVNAGVQVVIATARPPRSVREIHQMLGLETITINYNGALIHEPSTGDHIFHQPLPPGLSRKIVEAARKKDPEIELSYEILDQWYTDRYDKPQQLETAKAFSPDFIGDLESFIDTTPTKLMLLAPPQRLGGVHQHLKRKFGKKVSIVISDTHLLQVVHPQVDKGNALRAVAERLQIDQARVMAIGDAPNDLGMIRWAGTGCAVGNAWQNVRNAADHVVSANDDDGVAEAIERFVLS